MTAKEADEVLQQAGIRADDMINCDDFATRIMAGVESEGGGGGGGKKGKKGIGRSKDRRSIRFSSGK
jgi:hypothetical protein